MSSTSNEIRAQFIEFFTQRGHTFVRSAPVVPQDDPTLLFTNAGMNQFKSIFLGENRPGLTRAANSQKCMRVSGKHNDLEEVGRDHHHHTLFEMLGNWSFGDYYKKEAIQWAWELLTVVWKLPKNRLFVTVHHSDDEADRLWKELTDIDPSRVMKFGDKANFWEMGETGPCGPCSEIHYDNAIDIADQDATFADPIHGVNGENDRYREIWNLVFIQYNREKDGSLRELPSRHVDTGMGFERIVSVVQGVRSNYDTDLFRPIIAQLERMSGKTYVSDASGTPFRVIADHIRALTLAITDSAFPSNEGRGYVLRRLLRRAFRFGRELGFTGPFLYELVPSVVSILGEAFPEIIQRMDFVSRVIKGEEERFGQTLEQGLERFSAMVDKCVSSGSGTLAGDDVFALFDTFGFPMDLTRLMASEKGIAVDEAGFETLMSEQRSRARLARKGDDDGMSPLGWVELAPATATRFVGYDANECDAAVYRYKVLQAVDGADALVEGLVVLDRTPFYAESGGQVGDRGELVSKNGVRLVVVDTVKWNDMTVHRVQAPDGAPLTELSGALHARIDTVARERIRRNHSATHLVQAALRSVLGEHVNQSGSRVSQDGLRFDFTHFAAVTADEQRRVEDLVNGWIMADLPIETAVKGVDEAKKEGATALFGEKYGDTVRVLTMGGVSKELCGGTHARSTGTIGLFRITAESSIASGIRRIEATSGEGALALTRRQGDTLDALTSILKVNNDVLVSRTMELIARVKELETAMSALQSAGATRIVEELLAAASAEAGNLHWVVRDMGSMDKQAFAVLSDAVSDAIKARSLEAVVVVLAASVDSKALFSAGAGSVAVKQHGVHCGELVKCAAQTAGGGGGGSPTRAQAGGKDPGKIVEALGAVSTILAAKMEQTR